MTRESFLKFLTVHEAADILRVSASAVYDLCRRGHLDHVRLGTGRGVIRITEADLEAYLKSVHSGSNETPKEKPAKNKSSKLAIKPFRHIRIESPAQPPSANDRDAD